MAVVSVEEIPSARSGSRNERFEKFYKTKWNVILDGTDTGPMAAMDAVPVYPADIYDLGTGESDSLAACLTLKADCVSDDGCEYEVEVEYGPRVPREENPLDQPLEESLEFAQFERIVDVDADGNPVLNTAGDPFDPPVTRDDSRPILKIVRNEATFRPVFILGFRDCINESEFRGFPAGTVKCQPIPVRRAWHPIPGYYYIHAYEFHIDEDGWNKPVLSQGLRAIDGSGNRRQILIEGHPATSPVPLDENGAELAVGADPFYVTPKRYASKDFSVFNLD